MSLVVYTVKSLLALLIVLTPLISVSSFTALAAGIAAPRERHRIATRTSIAVAVLMLLFLAGGNYLFRFFGISLPAFQIAGGIVIFANGFAMVRAQTRAKFTDEEAREAATKDDFSIVPLAIPMICGPATISTVILYAAEAPDSNHVAALAAAVLIAAIIQYVFLLLASEVSRFLGVAGMNILTRIMGLLLASIAVQIIIRGVTASYALIKDSPAAPL